MSKSCLKILTTAVLLGIILVACGGINPDSAAPSYTPSGDTHSCLGVSVVTPEVIKLGSETTVQVEVSNSCNEAVFYTSSTPPYFLQLVSRANEIVWYYPSDAIPSLLGEFTVPANGAAFFDVAVTLSANDATPGAYRMIAYLSVDQDKDPAQYEEPLKLESKPQSVDVGR